MKISIITAVHNGAMTIEETLCSVAKQTHDHVEHIVVDGGSSDGTLEIVESYRAGLGTVISEPDLGMYDAMNKGIAQATGDIVGTLNADDVYAHEEVLARVAEEFASLRIDACYADLIFVGRHHLDRTVRYWKSCPFRAGLFAHGWIPAHPTFFARRTMYRRFGGFDVQYAFQSDFELLLRLLEIHRIRAKYVPEIFVKMRMGGTSNKSIRNLVRGNLESYRACRYHGLKVSPIPFFTRKFLYRLPQFWMRPNLP